MHLLNVLVNIVLLLLLLSQLRRQNSFCISNIRSRKHAHTDLHICRRQIQFPCKLHYTRRSRRMLCGSAVRNRQHDVHHREMFGQFHHILCVAGIESNPNFHNLFISMCIGSCLFRSPTRRNIARRQSNA